MSPIYPSWNSVVSRRASLLAGCASIVAVGCRRQPAPSGRVPTYPVHGRLLIDGQPAMGAMIKFVTDKSGGRVPTAIVREDGSFSASFYDVEDGAPTGNYKLVVAWMQVPSGGGLAQNRLRGPYLNPDKPVRTITVGAREVSLEPIELTSGTLSQP